MGKRLSHDRHIALVALAGGIPALAVTYAWLWSGDHSEKLGWTVALVVTAAWLAGAAIVRDRVAGPIRLIGNMLSALRQGDVSIRVRRTGSDDLGAAFGELNTLADIVRDKQLGALEAKNLLERVMERIEVAVFAFDDRVELQLVNAAGAELLGGTAAQLLHRTAEELGLAPLLEAEGIVQAQFAGGGGRYEVRRARFRQRGMRHELLVLSDVSRALRQEERDAWRRLIRVFGHEINNSLAPMQSIADSLQKRVQTEAIDPALRAELLEALTVIEARCRSLSRFMGDYARLAKLPPPEPERMDLGAFVERVAALEDRLPVRVEAGPLVAVNADAAQLEQALINLVRNGVDAALAAGDSPQVTVGWRADPAGHLDIFVRDNGAGLAGEDNLFVPFFSTKPGGSGIGLVLSRHIAEAHGGSVNLSSHPGGGCEAVLRLPKRTLSVLPKRDA